jgi:methyl-accepting chemotaxis protein
MKAGAKEKPMTTVTNSSNAQRTGFFTISRAMIVVGALVLAALAVVSVTQIQVIDRIKIGGNSFEQLMDAKDFDSDITVPDLYPVEAMAMIQIEDGDRSQYKTLKPLIEDAHKLYDSKFELWQKKSTESGLIQTAAGTAFFEQEKKLGQEFWDEYDKNYAPAIEQGDTLSQAKSLSKLSKTFMAFREFNAKFTGAFEDAMKAQQDRNLLDASSSQTFLTAMSIGIAALIALALAGAYFLVVKAITRISASMSKLAAGELETAIPYGNRSDEIGVMSGAVEVFKEQAIENRQNAHDAEIIIEALGKGMENLSNGNLAFRLNDAFPEELDRLRQYFNNAANSLQDTITSVKSGTDGIRSGTEEIAEASNDLSRRTENQAANLEETAAAVAEITSAVKKTASGAGHARSVVTAAKDQADKSGEVVRKAVEAMQGIEKSSQKINQIIGVIDEIAFQTNLLALNAGVEAARAGDAGRGFAVVASEVRALAQRSADAAKEIKDLLSTSRSQVENGVQLVAETGTSLQQIIERVTEINAIVTEIAASAEQQATGLQEVNTAVDQMDQVTQQNAAMVEEATAATRTLTQQSGELARVVARFTTSASAAINHVMESRKPTAASQQRAPLAPKKPASKVAASGGASREGWEEF